MSPASPRILAAAPALFAVIGCALTTGSAETRAHEGEAHGPRREGASLRYEGPRLRIRPLREGNLESFCREGLPAAQESLKRLAAPGKQTGGRPEEARGLAVLRKELASASGRMRELCTEGVPAEGARQRAPALHARISRVIDGLERLSRLKARKGEVRKRLSASHPPRAGARSAKALGDSGHLASMESAVAAGKPAALYGERPRGPESLPAGTVPALSRGRDAGAPGRKRDGSRSPGRGERPAGLDRRELDERIADQGFAMSMRKAVLAAGAHLSPFRVPAKRALAHLERDEGLVRSAEAGLRWAERSGRGGAALNISKDLLLSLPLSDEAQRKRLIGLRTAVRSMLDHSLTGLNDRTLLVEISHLLRWGDPDNRMTARERLIELESLLGGAQDYVEARIAQAKAVQKNRANFAYLRNGTRLDAGELGLVLEDNPSGRVEKTTRNGRAGFTYTTAEGLSRFKTLAGFFRADEVLIEGKRMIAETVRWGDPARGGGVVQRLLTPEGDRISESLFRMAPSGRLVAVRRESADGFKSELTDAPGVSLIEQASTGRVARLSLDLETFRSMRLPGRRREALGAAARELVERTAALQVGGRPPPAEDEYRAESMAAFLDSYLSQGAGRIKAARIEFLPDRRLLIREKTEHGWREIIGTFEKSWSGLKTRPMPEGEGFSVYMRRGADGKDLGKPFMRVSQYLGDWGIERPTRALSRRGAAMELVAGSEAEVYENVSRGYRNPAGKFVYPPEWRVNKRIEAVASEGGMIWHTVAPVFHTVAVAGKTLVDLGGGTVALALAAQHTMADPLGVNPELKDARDDLLVRAKANILDNTFVQVAVRNLAGEEKLREWERYAGIDTTRRIHNVGEEMLAYGDWKTAAVLQAGVDFADNVPMAYAFMKALPAVAQHSAAGKYLAYGVAAKGQVTAVTHPFLAGRELGTALTVWDESTPERAAESRRRGYEAGRTFTLEVAEIVKDSAMAVEGYRAAKLAEQAGPEVPDTAGRASGPGQGSPVGDGGDPRGRGAGETHGRASISGKAPSPRRSRPAFVDPELARDAELVARIDVDMRRALETLMGKVTPEEARDLAMGLLFKRKSEWRELMGLPKHDVKPLGRTRPDYESRMARFEHGQARIRAARERLRDGIARMFEPDESAAQGRGPIGWARIEEAQGRLLSRSAAPALVQMGMIARGREAPKGAVLDRTENPDFKNVRDQTGNTCMAHAAHNMVAAAGAKPDRLRLTLTAAGLDPDSSPSLTSMKDAIRRLRDEGVAYPDRDARLRSLMDEVGRQTGMRPRAFDDLSEAVAHNRRTGMPFYTIFRTRANASHAAMFGNSTLMEADGTTRLVLDGVDSRPDVDVPLKARVLDLGQVVEGRVYALDPETRAAPAGRSASARGPPRRARAGRRRPLFIDRGDDAGSTGDEGRDLRELLKRRGQGGLLARLRKNAEAPVPPAAPARRGGVADRLKRAAAEKAEAPGEGPKYRKDDFVPDDGKLETDVHTNVRLVRHKRSGMLAVQKDRPAGVQGRLEPAVQDEAHRVLARLEREGKVRGVRVPAVYHADGDHVIIEKVPDGYTQLRKLIHPDKGSPPKLPRAAYQKLLDAMRALNEAGITHGDMETPTNVYCKLTRDGAGKVTDAEFMIIDFGYGVSRHTIDGVDATAEGLALNLRKDFIQTKDLEGVLVGRGLLERRAMTANFGPAMPPQVARLPAGWSPRDLEHGLQNWDQRSWKLQDFLDGRDTGLPADWDLGKRMEAVNHVHQNGDIIDGMDGKAFVGEFGGVRLRIETNSDGRITSYRPL